MLQYPSFKSLSGRDAKVGVDFDPRKPMCQDDYEFYTGTGQYSDAVRLPEQPCWMCGTGMYRIYATFEGKRDAHGTYTEHWLMCDRCKATMTNQNYMAAAC